MGFKITEEQLQAAYAGSKPFTITEEQLQAAYKNRGKDTAEDNSSAFVLPEKVEPKGKINYLPGYTQQDAKEYAEKMAMERAKVKLPSVVENQGLYYAPGSKKNIIGAFGEGVTEGLESAFSNFANTSDTIKSYTAMPGHVHNQLKNVMYDAGKAPIVADIVNDNQQKYGVGSQYYKDIQKGIVDRNQKQATDIVELYKNYADMPYAETAINAGQGVGAMLPAILAGAAGGRFMRNGLSDTLTEEAKKKSIQYAAEMASKPVFAANVFGGAKAEALSSGASENQAEGYAMADTALELGIEALFGGIPMLGGGKISAKGLTEKYIKTAAGQFLVNRLVDITGEGIEEVSSGIIEPFLKRAFYDKDAKNASLKELASAFGNGALVSAILGAANIGGNVAEYNEIKQNIGKTEAKPDQAGVVTLPAPQVQPVTDTNAVPQADDTGVVPNVDSDTYIEQAKDKKEKSEYFPLAKLTDEEVRELSPIAGVDLTGFEHSLRGNDIRHLLANPDNTVEDLKKIPDIIKNPDIVFKGKNTGKYGDGDKLSDNPTIYYVKRHNGVTYYLEQVIEEDRTLTTKQMKKIPTGSMPKWLDKLPLSVQEISDIKQKITDISQTSHTDVPEKSVPSEHAQSDRLVGDIPVSLNVAQNNTKSQEQVSLPENSAKDNNVPGKTDANTNVGAKSVETVSGRYSQHLAEMPVYNAEGQLEQGTLYGSFETDSEEIRLKNKENYVKDTEYLREFIGRDEDADISEINMMDDLHEVVNYSPEYESIKKEFSTEDMKLLKETDANLYEELMDVGNYTPESYDAQINYWDKLRENFKSNEYRKYIDEAIENQNENQAVSKKAAERIEKAKSSDQMTPQWLSVENNSQNIEKPSENSYNVNKEDTSSDVSNSLPENEKVEKKAKLVPEKFAKEQAKKAGNDLPESVGAMKANEKSISHLVNEYGEMKPGENPARFVSVPVSTDGEDRVSLTSRTLMEAPATTEEVQELLEEGVVEGLFSHDIITDKGALKTALDDIKADGFESIYKEFKRKIRNDIILTKDDMATFAIMYATANKAGDTKVALDIATDIIARGTTMAQGLQAFRLFKKAAPVDKLWAIDKMAKAIENDIKKKDKNFEGIKVDKALKEKLTAAKTDAEINSVMADIEQNIADQVPSDWIDKINAWRYMAMLANPRTHIRNILGNTLFVPMKSFKDVIGATIEGGFEKSGKLSKDRRRKSLEAMTRRAKPFKEFASKDFVKAQDIISGQSRYAAKQGVYDKVKVFDNPILEGVRKKNSEWLESEDIFFLKKAYETAFAQAMISRGLKVSDVENSAKMLNEVRAIAINEAQKATYRDANSFAKGFDNIKKGMRKKARTAESNRGKVAWALGSIVMEGTVPFTKTPSNIIRRGIEYSPIGVINGICDVNKRVKNGDINLSEGIDRLAAGLSGTMIMALGALLSQLGDIRGAGDEDKNKKTIDELKGYQDYSLNIFGVNYTLDWMSPAAMPLFIGAELHKRYVERDGFRFADLMDSIMNITEPVFDMTMLQGVNSAIKTAGYSKTNPVTRIGENAVINYAGQFVPSVVGRLARTIDDTRRTTYDDKNNDMFNGTMQKFWQRTLNKLPGASKNQIPYMNAWGEADTTENVFVRAFENFASPGYINKIKNSDVNNEIERLYKQTGSAEAVPDKPQKYITESGQKTNMTAEQYEQFSKVKGQTSYKAIEALVKDSAYSSLTDEEKVKVIKDIYAYATTVAKEDVFNIKQTDTNSNRRKLLNAGVSPMDVFGRGNEIDSNGNGNKAKAEVMAFIDKQPGLTKTQKAYIFEVYYTGTAANPYI